MSNADVLRIVGKANLAVEMAVVRLQWYARMLRRPEHHK
jgi:hypothetical protein